MLFVPPRALLAEHPRPQVQYGLLPWRMAAMLCCPSCRGELRVQALHANEDGVEVGTLTCESHDCGAAFPVRRGIADMMPPWLLHDEGWQEWGAHLTQFEKRRTLRTEEATRLTSRLHRKKAGLQRDFARFTGIRAGVLLDVGCGPGKLRSQFDPSQVEYYGIDPMPLPEATAFPFARAVAEFIPFKTSLFTDVTVVSALDHFRDCSAFFSEVSRVLSGGGRLHVVQSIHDASNPLKLATHWIKDALEDRATMPLTEAAPHHMYEFTRESFLARVEPWFTVANESIYSRRWYSPDKLFLTLVKR